MPTKIVYNHGCLRVFACVFVCERNFAVDSMLISSLGIKWRTRLVAGEPKYGNDAANFEYLQSSNAVDNFGSLHIIFNNSSLNWIFKRVSSVDWLDFRLSSAFSIYDDWDLYRQPLATLNSRAANYPNLSAFAFRVCHAVHVFIHQRALCDVNGCYSDQEKSTGKVNES